MNKNEKTVSLMLIPYVLFLIVFVVLPLLVVIYYGFTDQQGNISFSNFINFFGNTRTVGTMVYSFGIAIITTVICLLLGYPVAYILAKGSYARKHAFLMIFVLPMWINFTLRITALKEILTMVEGNIALHPFFNTIVCMVYDFLPFMIMPLFNSIAKLDDSLTEAGRDLGATGAQVFFKIVIPLTIPGIVSAITMVFLPAMTNYVVLDMVYNSTYIMGSLIGSYFNAYDWNNGSVISAILLIMIAVLTVISNRIMRGKDDQNR
ncbi:MAG: ABC transporter permease [Lachnospiraceae bacterium]|nr:ABC transporter permease [Lachnospiraceae bacterium]